MLAVVGGLAGLVTVLGGVALTFRLWWRELPTESIVGGLPTSLFLSVGLDVTLQLLIFAGITALILLTDRNANWPVLIMVAAAFVLIYPFLRILDGRTLAFVVGVGGPVTALAGWVLLSRLRDNHLAFVVAVVLIFLAWRIPFEFTAAEIIDVKACTLTGTETLGLFVGESDSSVFIGVTETKPHFIAEIPGDQVYRLFLGEDLSGAKCPPVPGP